MIGIRGTMSHAGMMPVSFSLSLSHYVLAIVIYQNIPTCIGTECKSDSAVLRVSFALSLIFILQILGTLTLTRFFDLFWVPKIFLYVALTISFFFVRGR